MSKIVKLSKKSLLIVDNYNKSSYALNVGTYHIVVDFIENMKKHKLSAAKMYGVYEKAGLTPELKMTTFKNRLLWDKGTLEEFEIIGARDFNKFCKLKSKYFGVYEFIDKLAEEDVNSDSLDVFLNKVSIKTKAVEDDLLKLNELRDQLTVGDSERMSKVVGAVLRLKMLQKKLDSFIEWFYGDDVESKSGWRGFENSVRDEFIKHGVQAELTGGSADGGIDIIVKYNNVKIGVQVKDWKSNVGIKAIGEVLMGMGSYDCDYGCVVARNDFTKGCQTSAYDNDVHLLNIEHILWYVDDIKKKVKQLN